MKLYLSVFVLALTFEAQANLLSNRFSYIHHDTHERLEITQIDSDSQTAKYFDLNESKFKSVNLTDISRETNNELDGIRPGGIVLVKFADGSAKPCEIWHLYQNSLAHVGCQTGKISKNLGSDRPKLGTYTASTESMIKEVKSQDGFEIKDKVRLMKDIGDLKKGDLVRIEHIFQNGTSLIQKMGANLVDSSKLLMKSKVQSAELKDLSLNK